MRYFKYTLLILLILFINQCGFKVVNQSDLINFEVENISATGDKRINYILKNKILTKSKKSEKKLIKVNLQTNKVKNIKEKNIKNEITKYELIINADINVKEISGERIVKFSLSKTGVYNVANQYSQTLNNEKKLIDILSNSLAESVINKIANTLNDI